MKSLNLVKFKHCLTIVLITFLHCTMASATKYYVSSSVGSDNIFRDGKSESSAWKTISRVNRKLFSPGDSILFKKGDVWRETLIVPSSGNSLSYLVFASYGKGPKPKILGSEHCINWTVYRGNIWISATFVNDPYAGNRSEIFFTDSDDSIKWGNAKKTGIVDCVAEYNWTWNANKIYIYSPTDPNVRYRAIEAPQRNFCISLNDKEYITIDGLEVQFAKYSGIDFQGSYPNLDKHGLIIRNCYASYFASKNGDGFGIDAAYSNMLIQNNIIHDCGRRGISIRQYGAVTSHDIIVERNTLYNGFHTTGIDLSIGLTNTSHFNNIILRNNLIYDDANMSVTAPEGYASNLIFLQCYASHNSTFKSIYIYNNIFKYPSLSAIQIENLDNVFIFNNTFYGHNEQKTANTFHIWLTTGTKYALIKNNIFYTALDYHTNSSGMCIYCTINTSSVDSDYNLYYRTADNLGIAEVGGRTYYRTSASWTAYKSVTGWEGHSPSPGNPKFISRSDFHLQPGSPAIGKGINIKVEGKTLEKDYDGAYFNNPPCIGAYEGKRGSAPPDNHTGIMD
jgi:hypothetical protein